jgi:hypothetical protein
MTAKEELFFRWKLSELLHYVERHPIALEHLDRIAHGLLKPLLFHWIEVSRPDIDWLDTPDFAKSHKSHHDSLLAS